MKIKLIALDLDETVLHNDGSLSVFTKQILIQVVATGCYVVIASGRSFHTLPQELTSFSGISYAITSNGAALYDLSLRKMLLRHTISKRAVQQILQYAQTCSAPLEVFCNGEAHAASSYVAHPERYGRGKKAAAYIQQTRIPESNLIAFAMERRKEIEGFDFSCITDEQQKQVTADLQKQVAEIRITSSGHRLVEIMHYRAGKESMLQRLAQQLAIKQSEILAFGNGENDAAMLRWAGMGVAVRNAAPACLAAADVVTDSNEKDGVAKFLQVQMQNGILIL